MPWYHEPFYKEPFYHRDYLTPIGPVRIVTTEPSPPPSVRRTKEPAFAGWRQRSNRCLVLPLTMCADINHLSQRPL